MRKGVKSCFTLTFDLTFLLQDAAEQEGATKQLSDKIEKLEEANRRATEEHIQLNMEVMRVRSQLRHANSVFAQ